MKRFTAIGLARLIFSLATSIFCGVVCIVTVIVAFLDFETAAYGNLVGELAVAFVFGGCCWKLAKAANGSFNVPTPTGCCPDCGYDLTGNASGVCPECGSKIATK